MENLINSAQMKRLQVLYGQMARHTMQGSDRAARLAWASQLVCRPIESFSALSASDAGFLIDSLQQHLGVQAPRKRLSRGQARRAGLDGRKDGAEFAATPQMATPEDLRRIQHLVAQLGWSEQGLANFLGSQCSPLARRADKAIRTTADANKVWWSLKRIAQQKGIWRKTA